MENTEGPADPGPGLFCMEASWNNMSRLHKGEEGEELSRSPFLPQRGGCSKHVSSPPLTARKQREYINKET